MTKQEFNYELLIRGKTLAYHQDEIIDTFDEECYDIVRNVMRFNTNGFSGLIKVSRVTENNPNIGYYNEKDYTIAVNQLAHKLYIQSIKGTLMDMKERIKVYDQSIEALKQAKVGLFGDAEQIRLTVYGLNQCKDILQEIVDKCEHDIRYVKCYEDIPNGDERSLELAKSVLMSLNNVFIIRDPIETDTVGKVEGK